MQKIYSSNSYHVYGQALDYNLGPSTANYNLAIFAKTLSGATEIILYADDPKDDPKKESKYWVRYRNSDGDIIDGKVPLPGVIDYKHGHVGWRP